MFRVIEIMSILQGRQWGVCSMNEFRAFLGLSCARYFAREQRLVGDYPGVGLQESIRKPAEVV